MKIAVCLSGQPRSIEFATDSILEYFNTDEYSVDYFCHAWDYNTWKIKAGPRKIHTPYEQLPYDWLENQLRRFNPIAFRIDHYEKIYPSMQHVHWASLFYGIMYSNFLKTLAERYTTRYDYVVKSRYDVVFEPGRKFRPEHKVKERHLYFNHAERMHYRYNIINASDPIFYGDSWGMDIIADSYFALKTYYNTQYNRRQDQIIGVDPGTFIYQQANKYNVFVDTDRNNPADTIYRREMAGTDPKTDFGKILENHRSYYGT